MCCYCAPGFGVGCHYQEVGLALVLDTSTQLFWHPLSYEAFKDEHSTHKLAGNQAKGWWCSAVEGSVGAALVTCGYCQYLHLIYYVSYYYYQQLLVVEANLVVAIEM